MLPDVPAQFVSLTAKDPDRRVGYTVGDIITRELVLTVSSPYQLIETSLPIVGYEKRYRGQLIGIELHAIQHQKSKTTKQTIHRLRLSYQIFTNNVVAKPAGLGPEYVQLINPQRPNEVFKFRIPELDVAVSPLSIFGQIKIENDMSDWHGPLLRSSESFVLWRNISLTLLILSLLTLLYIVGERAWLVRMDGPFARAYRVIRKLDTSSQAPAQAIQAVHQALNRFAGKTLFSHELDEFVQTHSAFKPVQMDLAEFFQRSQAVYFDNHSAPHDSMVWLLQLVRRCRDCERGLHP